MILLNGLIYLTAKQVKVMDKYVNMEFHDGSGGYLVPHPIDWYLIDWFYTVDYKKYRFMWE
jgi:hypothetical protein